MNIIEIKNLKKIFKSGDVEIRAVDDISFSIPKGQFLSITGKSGSGKSTLMYQLGLLDYPTSGDIILDGEKVDHTGEKERTFVRLTKLGYVFQDYAIIPSLTAIENVIVPLLAQGMEHHDAIKIAEESLTKVGLAHRMHNLPGSLSGGEQQRVSIARAICHKPSVLFADEPTANLDTETSRTVLDVFKGLNKEGQTIIMVTHEDEYAEMADRIITLKDGKLVSDTHPA